MSSVKIIKWNKKEKANLVELKKELIREGLDPYVFESYPGEFYDEHMHEHDEIRIILQGSMIFGVQGKEYKLNSGDRLELKKETLHWAKNDGKETAVLLSASRY